MRRTVVLLDEIDRRLGTTEVPETVFVIQHAERFFVRTEKGVRLGGGGIGVVFRETEVYVRERLAP